MSLRRTRQMAVERAAESGARAALQTLVEETSGRAVPLNIALEVMSAPAAPGTALVRASATRRLQGALGNGALSRTFAEFEIVVEPLRGMGMDMGMDMGMIRPERPGPARGEGAGALEAAYTEEVPPPQTSPESASAPMLPPAGDAVSTGEPAAEAPTEAVEAGAEAAEAAAEAKVEAGAGAEAAEAEAAIEGEAAGGAAEGEAVVEGEAAAGGAAAGGGAAAEVPILMPEPPAELSSAAQERVGQVKAAAGGAAGSQAAMPPAAKNVSAARGAVTEPAEETAARAQASLVKELGASPGPSPEIEKLCTTIKETIKSKRPTDEKSLVKAKPKEMAKDAGGQLNKNVEGDTKKVAGAYDGLDKPPQGEAGQQGQPAAAVPGAPPAADIKAQSATPDAVPAENVSLAADAEANKQRMDKAGMDSPAAREVKSGPVAEARAAQGELEVAAARDPAEVLAEQEGALAGARTDMAALQEGALAALQESRATTTAGVEGQRGGMVGTEEQMRAEAGRRAQEIFAKAQTAVNTQLDALPGKAMGMWEKGVAIESTKFEAELKVVEEWIKERHSGGWGTLVSAWDAVTGLPGSVKASYDRAEEVFGNGVCALMRDISANVNLVIAACQAIIKKADSDIAVVYGSLPQSLQGWAAGEREKFQGQLSELSQKATATRDNFNREMMERASQAVQDVRVKIEGLRQKAKGLLGRAIDAINAFIDDPVRAIINGLLELLGIAPAAFWALVERIGQVINDIADDPMNFANNLVEALKQGFQLFFDNFGAHFLQGLLDWLFSGLGSVGVQVPKDFSLKSVITFFLQLMGLTWPNIRKILAKHIGEENVAMIEQAWEFISMLIEQGPSGIFEMIKEQLNPQNILDTILKMAVDFVIETLIKQVVVRVIGLLNPAGAIAQAIEVIYKVLKWIFTNAARIFKLVETVVNGVADIIKGNVGGMAKTVEKALAMLLVPVIDFLADFLGLGDLPDKVAKAIGSLQETVLGYVDKAVGWIVKKVKGLLAKVGGKDKPDERTEEQKAADVSSAVDEASALNQDKSMSVKVIRRKLAPIKKKYRLSVLELVKDKETETQETFHIFGEINPKKTGPKSPHATKMQVVTLTWTYDPNKHDPIDYRQQLQEQEQAINAMTIAKWFQRRQAFVQLKTTQPKTKGRPPGSSMAQRKKRAEFRSRILRKLAQRSPGAENDPTELQRVDTLLSKFDATHELDIVAGGEPEKLGLGTKSVNRSIGSQWPAQINIIVPIIQVISDEDQAGQLMNVKLVARRR